MHSVALHFIFVREALCSFQTFICILYTTLYKFKSQIKHAVFVVLKWQDMENIQECENHSTVLLMQEKKYVKKCTVTLNKFRVKTSESKSILTNLSHTLSLSAKSHSDAFGLSTTNIFAPALTMRTSQGNSYLATVSRRQTVLPPWRSSLLWAWALFCQETPARPDSSSPGREGITAQD